tara:strand:- start:629 stop:1069 length:441 start_codon:yes stop_codon:yes gene_type:complete
MAISGKYKPEKPAKYKGDPTNVIYRSLWERKFMVFCDSQKSVVKWGSEEIVIPYRSPKDGKIHRYYPDFYMKTRERGGGVKESVIEIKPAKQCKPPKEPKRKTARYKAECLTYLVNQAKWKYARKWCKERNLSFVILTENELNIYK